MKSGRKRKLPLAIRLQLVSAWRIGKKHRAYLELHPRRGAPRTPGNYQKTAILTASTAEELDNRLKTLEEIIGARGRGNKRLGRVAQYAELQDVFEHLQTAGITLPSDSSLSAKACQYGLGDWLRRHGYTLHSDARLAKDSNERDIICRRKCGSAFNQVKQVLENTPLKIG